MQSTIQLFRHLYERLPPLFPPTLNEKMRWALERAENDPSITLEAIERLMIAQGYEVWPWNQAYKESLQLAEEQLGEHFLLPKLSAELQTKYHDFKVYGGVLNDLQTGNAAQFFTDDERGELCSALITMQRELRSYVASQVIGLERAHYLRRVEEFKTVLQKIKDTLEELRELANKEQDHPVVSAEILQQVQSFEHGLCLLGPEPRYEAVCQAVEFFHGRRQELNRMKGIHLPLEVDFYH